MTSARSFPLGGIAFVALAVASLLVAGETPASGASAEEVASFYGDDAARQWFSAFLAAAAAPFAVLFGIGLADALSNETRSRWGDVVRAGGILVAAAALLGAGVHVAVVDGGEQDISDTALQALNTLDGNTWIAFTSGLGVLLLGAAGALLTSGSQRVLGWSALVLGVALFLPFVDFLAMLAAALWIVVASVVVPRGSAASRRDVGASAATTATLCVLGLLFALALSGCGGSDSEEGVPPELVGTYTTTLDEGDIPPNSARELTPGEWNLVIAATGAADGGPVLAIEHPVEGTLEGPGLKVDGDRFLLVDEECAQETGYVFYDNEYSWTLEGSTLTLATVKNDCPDRVAETILTSNAWTKQP